MNFRNIANNILAYEWNYWTWKKIKKKKLYIIAFAECLRSSNTI